MKALILAAGFGTRLLPHTRHIPKPLFPVGGITALERVIRRLMNSGCTEIVINTHHLHHQIEAFITEKQFPVLIHTRFEPEILGTGGAIKNTSDILGDQPFIVMNSDVITDIDIASVYDFHLGHPHPATLVLHDRKEFNKVAVTDDGFIKGFHGRRSMSDSDSSLLAFTGIQVLDPELCDRIKENTYAGSIDIYTDMIDEHINIKAYISSRHFWIDIGTPESYKKAAYRFALKDALRSGFPDYSEAYNEDNVSASPLKGDGSDRQWHRIASEHFSLIMADHGIREHKATAEVDSFIAINRHLSANGVNVPKLYHAEPFSGLVFMEDLGDIHLQHHTRQKSEDVLVDIYKRVIDALVHMSVSCAKGFSPSFAYQTSGYNQQLILEKECRYFLDAFLAGYLRLDIPYARLENDFNDLAEKALSSSFSGFMHRDFQSRNIMYHDDKFYFIDYQGGRIGPLQYDLASLLLDPYVALPFPLHPILVDHAVNALSSFEMTNPDMFRKGYIYCSLTRNLQILGAFGFLTKVKAKPFFDQFIPAAVRSLKYSLGRTLPGELQDLKAVVNEL